MNNLPLYTTEKLVPDELDIAIGLIAQLPKKEFDEYAEKLRLYLLNLYDINHFPVGTQGRSLEKIIFDLRKFNDQDVSDILVLDDEGNNNILMSFNKWYTAVNHWFPEMYDTKISSNKLSIIDQLRDASIFNKNLNGLINKDQFSFVKNYPLDKFSSYIASGFRVINGNQPAVNFPAGVAKWIYLFTLNKSFFKYKNDIYVLDTSAGWGGRLLGLLSACSSKVLEGKRVHLFCTDVNTNTHERFESIVSFWKEFINPNLNFEFYKSILPAEDLLQDPVFRDHIGMFDVALTSPPYFDRERYSDDTTQSYMRYKTYPEWKKGFLQGTLSNIYQLLNKDGYNYWNIADIKISSAKDNNYILLEEDSIEISKQLGFRFIRVYKMLMSSMVGITRVNGNKVLGKNKVSVGDRVYKFEPIFTFKKE